MQVDPEAFDALVACVASADFDTCEAVPAGGTENLENPLGGIATDMAGPARYHDMYCLVAVVRVQQQGARSSLRNDDVAATSDLQGGAVFVKVSRLSINIYVSTTVQKHPLLEAFIYTIVEDLKRPQAKTN